MTRQQFKQLFPPRKKNAHKGDFGHVLILAGSRAYPGAPYLTALAALRAGAGLVSLGVPESIYPIMARKLHEAMPFPLPENKAGALSARSLPLIRKALQGKTVLAIGPGLTRDLETAKLVRDICGVWRGPLVLDADGLNTFSGKITALRNIPSAAVLTPHAGEAKRLFAESVPEGLIGRKNYAREMSRKCGKVLLLKGHQTVIADPAGNTAINNNGNPGLAKGGSGDVLTGILVAFLARGLTPFDAASAAAFLHGYTADLAVRKTGENSLLASDLLTLLPQAFLKLLVPSSI